MEKVFYYSGVYFSESKLPVYIFDSTRFNDVQKRNFKNIFQKFEDVSPNRSHVLVMFNSGMKNCSWGLTVKTMISILSKQIKNNYLKNIFVVHSTWSIKTIIQLVINVGNDNANIILKKLLNFSAKKDNSKGYERKDDNFFVSFNTLSELNEYINLKSVKISLKVLQDDFETLCILQNLKSKYDNNIKKSIVSKELDLIFYTKFYKIFKILDQYSHKKKLIFDGVEDDVETNILLFCIKNNQSIWLNDWNLSSIASLFKKIIFELQNPLVPLELISDEIKGVENVIDNFNSVLKFHENNNPNHFEILIQLFNMCKRISDNNRTTYYSPLSLALSLHLSLTHVKISNYDYKNFKGIIFIKYIIQYWNEIQSALGTLYHKVEVITPEVHQKDSTFFYEFENSGNEILMKNKDFSSSSMIELNINLSYENKKQTHKFFSNDFDVKIMINDKNLSSENCQFEDDMQNNCNSTVEPVEKMSLLDFSTNNIINKTFSTLKDQLNTSKCSFDSYEFLGIYSSSPKEIFKKSMIRGKKVSKLVEFFDSY